MTTETITMPFRCAACGPIDCLNLVHDASIWFRVHLVAGVVTADADSREEGEEQGTNRIECANCGGSAAMADGSPIVVEDWV